MRHIQETVFLENKLTCCKLQSTREYLSKMNCAQHTQQNSPNSTIINNSRNKFKKYLFANMNLRAARIVSEQATSRQKMECAHHATKYNWPIIHNNQYGQCRETYALHNQLRKFVAKKITQTMLNTISSIFYKVNLFVLTSYDCEEFAHKKNCQTIRNIAHVTEIFVNQSYVLCGERQTASTDAWWYQYINKSNCCG